ncbi:NUDIX hydrolase [Sandaracinus amylolyticus]|uniref:NUDIX hydrolase n=1 Tax=Sandaracinus amylolyticus TaxID=927083 RepID=UPI001F19E62C|nr:NUDIX domain-containing protein [Sandaracinus amylolyticus]UJR79571.1 Bifunctional nicotinamide mononucleotide adenylyltransferase/ADP-ribose pyrophosphatase [Sandaracinus amylolyticus]
MTKRARPDQDDDGEVPEGYDVSRFERPSVAVDVALLTVDEGALRTLLLRRDAAPYRGRWALPGGFVGIDEALDDAAARVLEQKTGIRRVFLEQLYTFGAPKRDPRTRVITVAHYALVDPARLADAREETRVATLEVPWEGETGGPVDAMGVDGRTLPLAFDHADILGMAVKRVRGKLDYTPIGFQLLPERFTLAGLQRVHETVLGRPLNKDSFRRRMLASGQLEATGDLQTGVDHRPAELYRFARRSAV